LSVWSGIIFLVAENGPQGLYYLKFPLFYALHPDRIFTLLAYPASIVAGFGLTKIIQGATASADVIYRVFRKDLSHQTRRFLRLITLCAALLIVGSLCIPETIRLHHDLISSRFFSFVTEADIQAFQWIINNTPENATFTGIWMDATGWIPAFTGRRTIPSMANINDPWMSLNYTFEANYIIAQVHDFPNSPETHQLLKKYQISYVYCGARALPPHTPPNPRFFDPNMYELVYSRDNVSILKVSF